LSYDVNFISDRNCHFGVFLEFLDDFLYSQRIKTGTKSNPRKPLGFHSVKSAELGSVKTGSSWQNMSPMRFGMHAHVIQGAARS